MKYGEKWHVTYEQKLEELACGPPGSLPSATMLGNFQVAAAPSGWVSERAGPLCSLVGIECISHGSQQENRNYSHHFHRELEWILENWKRLQVRVSPPRGSEERPLRTGTQTSEWGVFGNWHFCGGTISLVPGCVYKNTDWNQRPLTDRMQKCFLGDTDKNRK